MWLNVINNVKKRKDKKHIKFARGQKVPKNVRKPLLDTSLNKKNKKNKKVQKNEVIMDRPTDRPTDRQTERQTDRWT